MFGINYFEKMINSAESLFLKNQISLADELMMSIKTELIKSYSPRNNKNLFLSYYDLSINIAEKQGKNDMVDEICHTCISILGKKDSSLKRKYYLRLADRCIITTDVSIAQQLEYYNSVTKNDLALKATDSLEEYLIVAEGNIKMAGVYEQIATMKRKIIINKKVLTSDAITSQIFLRYSRAQYIYDQISKLFSADKSVCDQCAKAITKITSIDTMKTMNTDIVNEVDLVEDVKPIKKTKIAN